MKKVSYEYIKNRKINLIDVQEKYEYKLYHLPGSINIPYDTLISDYKRYLNKNDTYYITCKMGHLSKRACTILDFLGYNVICVEK